MGGEKWQKLETGFGEAYGVGAGEEAGEGFLARAHFVLPEGVLERGGPGLGSGVLGREGSGDWSNGVLESWSDETGST
jgi:hypothetical protein